MRVAARDVVVTLVIAATQGCADPDPRDPPQTPPSSSDLQIDLRMQSPAVSNHEAVLADVTITNTGTAPVQLLSWYLPATDLAEPVFTVTRDGQPVAYTGPRYKRGTADATDFVVLAPGAASTWQVDLARFYDFSRTGDYAVQVKLDAAVLASAAALASAPSSVWVEGRAIGDNQRKPTKPCAASEQALVDAAIVAAGGYANAARDYLGGSASATLRYTTWFGAFSSGGWNTARNHYAAIANAFATQPITADCSCRQKNVYAYVYPDQPYKIYLCGAFWQAPATGTDSKAGTLVHEMSHFDVVASTNDWAYGQAACKSLAQSDPTKALDNADSHEYFAENTPAQP